MKRMLILGCLCAVALEQTRAGREIRVEQKRRAENRRKLSKWQATRSVL